jgi:hypothetical protein
MNLPLKAAIVDLPPKTLPLPANGQNDSRNRRYRYRVTHACARRRIQLIDYGMIQGSAVLTLWYVRLWFFARYRFRHSLPEL